MESFLLSGKPSSHALHSGRSLSGDKLGMEGLVTRNLLHGFGTTTKPTSENPQGNNGEKTTGLESESQHGTEEISLELKLGSTTFITKKRKASENPEGNDGKKSKISEDKTTGIETRSDHGLEEISLKLELGCGTCTTKKRKATETSSAKVPPSSRKKERHSYASIELKLELGPRDMKKRIETSDIGDSSRLLLPKKWVQEHILGLWDAQRIASGIPVAVWDFDTKSEHELIFKYWPSGSGSYVLNRNWTVEFVKRRSLKKGDEIGLYWDPANSRFIFRLLNPTPRG
ncbi:hypothetical protein FH972_012233 [Carpinus fangiana]|uniref:TF-B3 domain-containing protein n=1 Tax=Carpinus fangiana TaxID=176857 RepID=A0A5N6R4N0_9ROSI|nr:hypothetical protein FH972_012233 [Carpinus fangiana]